MTNLRFSLAAAFLIVLLGLRPVSALDVTSGASKGQSMVSVSAITTTSNSAKLTYSECCYTNGTLRFYHSTTAFASSADTTRSTVTKLTMTQRSKSAANLTVTGLTENTKYYFRIQGWYGHGEANYWAKGSFTTAVSTGVVRATKPGISTSSPAKDPLGRPTGSSSGATFRTTGSELNISH